MRPVLPPSRVIVPAAIVLILVGCGSGGEPGPSSDTESAPPAAESESATSSPPQASADPGGEPSSGEGNCSVDVTGDLATSWEGSGGSAAVGTDYWYTRDELEEAAEFLGGMTEGEPVFFVLVINCSASDTSQNVSLLPASGTGFDDIPYAPASYAIAVPGESEAGQFTSIFLVDEGALFAVSSPGELDITTFDETGIAGTFRFPATEVAGAREIEVSGSFDFACTGRSVCRP